MLTRMSLFHRIFDQFYPIIRFVYERALGHRWYDKIVDNLWMGGAPTYPRDYDFLIKNKIGAVVDIRQEREDDLALYKANDIRHLKLKVPDIHAPSPEIIEQGVSFIEEQINDGRIVYVHCAKGRGRSATLVAGYLMKQFNFSFEEARRLMVDRRPLTKLEERHKAVLEEWREEI